MPLASYQRRILDDELDVLMPGLPAISIDGARGVGKTATASRRSRTIVRLDRPDDRELLGADEGFLARSSKPVLLDEWQRFGRSWDMVRRAVDDDSQPGQFLLTGSAAPVDHPTHSGAGRIVRLRMRPMSFAERRPDVATVSFADLLSGSRPDIQGSSNDVLADYVDEIVTSGFPALRSMPERARGRALDGYLASIVQHDFVEQGHTVRRPDALRAWMSAYAAATATTASFEAIRDAATPGDSDKPTRQTASGYRDVLSQMWMLDPISGWLPQRNLLGRLAQAPKHHMADPALACRLLGLGPGALLSTGGGSRGVHVGQMFESLVTQSVLVYAQSAEGIVRHLRTRNADHQVDLIVERADGRCLAVEVKLSPEVSDHDVRHLRWLRDRAADDVVDLVVVTTGRNAYRRNDGVAVVPLSLLGP